MLKCCLRIKSCDVESSENVSTCPSKYTQKLRYGLICWATASKFILNKVNVVHNKVIRYLTFSKPCSRAWPLYRKLDVLPLDILIELEWGKFMYKYQNKMLPAAFDSYFVRPKHHYSTRFTKQNNFEITRKVPFEMHRTQKMVLYTFIHERNSISENLHYIV